MNEMPKPLQVYIVEDSPIIQRLLASAITEAGAEPVGCSADAQTAIADLFALQPDLILIDISFGWGWARVSWQTKKIKGLHENDFIMAAKTNELHGV